MSEEEEAKRMWNELKMAEAAREAPAAPTWFDGHSAWIPVSRGEDGNCTVKASDIHRAIREAYAEGWKKPELIQLTLGGISYATKEERPARA